LENDAEGIAKKDQLKFQKNKDSNQQKVFFCSQSNFSLAYVFVSGIMTILEYLNVSFLIATQFYMMFDERSIDLIKFTLVYGAFEMFKNATTEKVADDLAIVILVDSFKYYIKSTEFIWDVLRMLGYSFMLVEFYHEKAKIENGLVEPDAGDHCFVFFTEPMIAALFMQLPLILDITKLQKSFDALITLIEANFNEEKNANKFNKLKNVLNIVRIMIFQFVSLIACSCCYAILCDHTRIAICEEHRKVFDLHSPHAHTGQSK